MKNTVGGNGTFSYTSSGGLPSPADGSGGFSITTSGAGHTGQAVFNNVVPGSYTVTESGPPSGWDFTSLSCTTGGSQNGTTQEADITLPAGGSVTCTYTNTKHGSLTIAKQSVGGTSSFGFTSTSTGIDPSFSISTVTTNPNSKNFDLNQNQFGTKQVTETVPTGWDLTNIACTGTTPTSNVLIGVAGNSSSFNSTFNAGDNSVKITVGAGENPTCTFTNTKRANITVFKYNDLNLSGSFDSGEPGLSGWRFFVDLNGNGVKDANETTTGVTDGTGNFTFNLAAGTYTFCEVLQSGWVNTDPGSNLMPCKTITVVAGDNKTLRFGNAATLPLGAKTIGFWRNKNGQGIILNFCGGTSGTTLYSYLIQFNPFKDLTSTTCSGIASYVTTTINNATKSKINAPSNLNAMLKAQMLATALDVYFSTSGLGGNKIKAPAPIGGAVIDLKHVCNMFDYVDGTAVCIGTEDASSAFGGASSLTVNQILSYAASQATAATASNPLASPWYGQDKGLQKLAKDTFDAINNNLAF